MNTVWVSAELRQKIDLMADNYHSLREAFAWDSTTTLHFGAMMTAIRNARIDVERVKLIKTWIKDHTGWTSYFRGQNTMVLALLMQGDDNYQQLFDRTVKIHDELTKKGFRKGYYLPLAAYTLAKSCEDQQLKPVYERMEAFYQSMKQHHFWLTSEDDYIFAALMAASELEINKTCVEIENCYEQLRRDGLVRGNDLQSLSHVLALGEEATVAKCERAVRLYGLMKEKKCKMGYEGLSSLGILALLGKESEEISSEIAEAYTYLYNKEGYGFWGIDGNMRALLAIAIVADHYADQLGSDVMASTMANSISSIMIAQQTAVIAAAAAASAACTSASS